MKALIKKLLYEHLQQADKVYFNTGKLSSQDRENILAITNGDAYTKAITDIYAAYGEHATNYLDNIANAYADIKSYNKNVLPIEDFNLSRIDKPLELVQALENRRNAISELSKLPSIALRNLRNDIRVERTKQELFWYYRNLDTFLTYYGYLSNRDEKFQKVVQNKMFKGNTTLNDLLNFVEDKHNLLGGVKFTRNKVEEIVRDDRYGELEIKYRNGNIMVIEVSGPNGIKQIGCNSVWCFTYGSGFEQAYRQWGNFSTNAIVYAIIDFSQSPESYDFMYVLIKPLDYTTDGQDDDNDDGTSPLFNMANEPESDPLGTINDLIGLDNAKKLFTFGEEPKPVQKPKEKAFVDPNQLSLFESKQFIKQLLRNIV